MVVDWLWSGESRPKKTWVQALQRAQEDLPLGTAAASALPVLLCIKSCLCVDRDLLCDISHPPCSETLRIRSDSVELLRFLRQAGSSSRSHDEVEGKQAVGLSSKKSPHCPIFFSALPISEVWTGFLLRPKESIMLQTPKGLKEVSRGLSSSQVDRIEKRASIIIKLQSTQY